MDKVMYKGYNTPMGPSPAIWGECPILDLLIDPTQGMFFHENWSKAGPFTSATVSQGYLPYFDTGGSIVPLGTSLTSLTDGIISRMHFTTDTDQDDISALQWGAGGVTNNLDSGKGTMWFEACIQFSSITNGKIAWLVGLAEESCAADAILAVDGADIADKDFVGFMVDSADCDALDCIYQTSGSAFTLDTTYSTALVAATNIKVGMIFNPANAQNMLHWFVNGVKIADVSVEGSGFPDGEEVSPLFAVETIDNSTAVTFDVGWWRIAQLY